MTLEEAIIHCEEKSCGNSECAKEYQQLAKWLKELKVFRASSYSEIMEKYNNALSRARDYHKSKKHDRQMCAIIESFFPELKPSKEERILDAISDIAKLENCQISEILKNHDLSTTNIVNWLNKQKESIDKIDASDVRTLVPKFEIGDVMRTKEEAKCGYKDGMPVIVSIDEDNYHCTNENIPISHQDEYEYPPINRQKLTIERDHWYVCIEDYFAGGKKCASKGDVVQAKGGMYMMGLEDGSEYFKPWSIQDAKPGDILAGKDVLDSTICIFRKIMKDDDETDVVDVYCGIDTDGKFVVDKEDELWCNADELEPATKEEKDNFFVVMKHAGYFWDAFNKEIKLFNKFNIGDEIINVKQPNIPYKIVDIAKGEYILTGGSGTHLPIECQQFYEKVKKFPKID